MIHYILIFRNFYQFIFLKITNKEEVSDKQHVFIAKGLYKNVTVGFKVEVESEINAGFINGEVDSKNGFVKNGISFSSIGKESDEFIIALDKLLFLPLE